MTYTEWFNKVIFLKDKVILPNNISVDKIDWITNKGFDFDNFNLFLKKQYYKQTQS